LLHSFSSSSSIHPAPTPTSTLSLHDALPISLTFTGQGGVGFERSARITVPDLHAIVEKATEGRIVPKDFVPSPVAHPHCYSISRSEEHTSELQSRENLVCRLLLEKKKKKNKK